MNHFFFLLSTVLIFNTSLAQDEIHYNNPPGKLTSDYRIDLVDAVSTEDYCKLKVVIDNKSKDAYLVFKGDGTGFEYDGIGTYYPKKTKEMVVKPTDKSSYVVKVDRDMDYRKHSFKLTIEGLLTGTPTEKLATQQIPVSLGKESSYEADDLKVVIEELEGKKGKFTAKLTISFNGSDNELITVDPLKFQLLDAAGAEIFTECNNTKLFTLRPGEEEKLKLNFESSESAFLIDQSSVYQKILLYPLSVEPFIVVDGSPVPVVAEIKPVEEKVATPTPVTANQVAEKTSCPPFMGQKNGSVKIKVYSEEGACFKLDIDGFPAITEYTSNAFVYANPGRRRYTITMANGTVLEEKAYVADNYDEIGYKIKQKGGDYSFKYVVGDQVMNAKGRQEMDAMMARTKATNDAAMNKNSNTNTPNSNSGGSPTTNNGNSEQNAGGGTCFGEASSGSKTVKLKITWKGQPVSGHGIQVKAGGAVLGNNVTDGSGNVSVRVSELPSSNVDVYGCKGNSSWSVTGDWVVLDGSNYFHLKLDELAEFMSEMMGMSVDEIGAGWGM